MDSGHPWPSVLRYCGAPALKRRRPNRPEVGSTSLMIVSTATRPRLLPICRTLGAFVHTAHFAKTNGARLGWHHQSGLVDTGPSPINGVEPEISRTTD
jgi:hypothetical protein